MLAPIDSDDESLNIRRFPYQNYESDRFRKGGINLDEGVGFFNSYSGVKSNPFNYEKMFGEKNPRIYEGNFPMKNNREPILTDWETNYSNIGLNSNQNIAYPLANSYVSGNKPGQDFFQTLWTTIPNEVKKTNISHPSMTTYYDNLKIKNDYPKSTQMVQPRIKKFASKSKHSERANFSKSFNSVLGISKDAEMEWDGPHNNYNNAPLIPSGTKRKMNMSEDFSDSATDRMKKRAKRFGLDAEEADKNIRRLNMYNSCGANKSLNDFIDERKIYYNKSRFEGRERYHHNTTWEASNKIMVDRHYFPPAPQAQQPFRPVVIDGSNVAHAFGEQRWGQKQFDCLGIRLCVDYFMELGCNDVTVVIPEARFWDPAVKNLNILHDLQNQNQLFRYFSRKLPSGGWVSSYDDRAILDLAFKRNGIVVSNDTFRDLQHENEKWRKVIFERVLPFRFYLNEGTCQIMFPPDPFGKYGMSLLEFIRFPRNTSRG